MDRFFFATLLFVIAREARLQLHVEEKRPGCTSQPTTTAITELKGHCQETAKRTLVGSNPKKTNLVCTDSENSALGSATRVRGFVLPQHSHGRLFLKHTLYRRKKGQLFPFLVSASLFSLLVRS